MRRLTDREILSLAEERGGTVRRVKLPDPPQVVPAPPETRAVLMGRRHVLMIPDWVPVSVNKSTRGKIKRGIRTTRAVKEVVMAAAYMVQIPPARTARRVLVEAVFPDLRSLPDPDNLAKLTLDALQHCGLLISDTYANAEWVPPVYYHGSRRMTRITLTDIPAKRIGPPPEDWVA